MLQEQWSTVLALTAGLITFKAVITTFLGPIFGLSKSDSVRTGLLLSGGGEFAFVVLTLADKLHVLPDLLAKILVGVVVISMALTPTLGGIADRLGNYIDKLEKQKSLELAVLSGKLNSSVIMRVIENYRYFLVDLLDSDIFYFYVQYYLFKQLR